MPFLALLILITVAVWVWGPKGLTPKAKLWLKVSLGLVAVGQAIAFGLFILEEALQTVMFAVWQLPKGGGDRQPLAVVYRAILDTGWAMVRGLGWIHPFGFVYNRYFQAAEAYYVSAFLSP